MLNSFNVQKYLLYRRSVADLPHVMLKLKICNTFKQGNYLEATYFFSFWVIYCNSLHSFLAFRPYLHVVACYYILLAGVCTEVLTVDVCDPSVGRHGEAQDDIGSASHPESSPGLICSHLFIISGLTS